MAYTLASFLLILLSTSPAASLTVGFLMGSGGLGDESFNDMTYKGMSQAKQKLGFNLVVREWEHDISMEKMFLQLIEEKAEIIVLNGDQFLPLIEKFSPRFPETYLIANDFEAGSYPNVKSIVYSQHEGSFLAGVLAASMSESLKIGFVGAIDTAIIKAFQTGYKEGVQHISKEVEIVEEYISRLPDYSGYNNPRKGFQIASDLYANGVDVIFAVAGSSGNGIIQAAKENRKYVIGVDSDQDHMAKGFVLTSVMKRLDIAVYTEIIHSQERNMNPGTVWYGLNNGGISLTPMRYSMDIIPAAVRQNLKEIEKQIMSGKIVVTNSLLEEQ